MATEAPPQHKSAMLSNSNPRSNLTTKMRSKMRSIAGFTTVAALCASITTSLCATIPLPRSSELFPRGDAPELEKPAINPPFSEAVQDRDLRTEMVHHTWRYEEWNEYWIPEHCLEEAEYNKLSGDDFDVRTVWYDDCAAPWVICRHRLAREHWESILVTLGQVPVGMRQYLANLIILPSASGSSEMTNAAAYTRGAVMVFTPSFFKLGVLFHEFAHILDTISLSSYIVSQGLGKPGTPFSETSIWKSAYGNDTHVPTAYARMTFQEDFADIARWTMSDIVHRPFGNMNQPPSYSRGGYGGGYKSPAAGIGQAQAGGGLRLYSPGWEGCKWQILCFKRFIAPIIFTKTGRCTGKVRSSKPVPVPGALNRLVVGSGVGKLPSMGDEMHVVDGNGEEDEDEDGGVVGDIDVPDEVEDEVHVYRGPAPGSLGY